MRTTAKPIQWQLEFQASSCDRKTARCGRKRIFHFSLQRSKFHLSARPHHATYGQWLLQDTSPLFAPNEGIRFQPAHIRTSADTRFNYRPALGVVAPGLFSFHVRTEPLGILDQGK